jgi:F0F1-type ATP synthase membrane subunit b/b'
MRTVVVSVRIREEVKRLLEESGVNISEEVRRFLEELAAKVKTRKYVEVWDGLLSNVKPAEEGFSATSVREDRESR